MASMSISLPDQMRDFVKSRIESGQYNNESEYIRDLIRHDQNILNNELKLLAMLRESEASGVSGRNMLDIMKDVEERMQARGQI